MSSQVPQQPPDRRKVPLPSRFVRAGVVARAALGAIGAARIVLRRAAEALLAVVIVFEEWGWQPLAAALARLARFAPVRALEAAIVRLPPYGALVVFAVPSVLILPLKLLALWLIASGHALAAAGLFIAAKVVGTAIVARLYQLTEPRLMQLEWFRRAHDWVMPRLHALSERVRASGVWRQGRLVKRALQRRLALWRPLLEPMLQTLRARVRRLLGR